jgi:hypothetical protein
MMIASSSSLPFLTLVFIVDGAIPHLAASVMFLSNIDRSLIVMKKESELEIKTKLSAKSFTK